MKLQLLLLIVMNFGLWVKNYSTCGCYGLSSFVFVILFAMLCSFWSAVYRVAFSFWVAAMYSAS